MTLPFTPVVIIGAARSGTNMLRDMLSALPGFATWPCDEINPIWRHGNRRWPDDEIPAELAGRGRKYIRQSFGQMWKWCGKPRFIVEKTCANTLRVPFVSAILPEARFVQIIRDGADVVPSAEQRWRGGLELNAVGYLVAKARFIPISDMPLVGVEFLRNRLPVHFGSSKRFRIWGPRFTGLDAMLRQPLCDICAWQWVTCMERSDTAFASFSGRKWLRLWYEDIVAAPADALRDMMAFLEVDRMDRSAIAASAAIASPRSAKERSPPPLSQHTEAILHSVRQRHGYVV